MPAKTNNIYGKISISASTIARFITHVGMDSYGVVEFGGYGLHGKIRGVIEKSYTKGVNVTTKGDRIGIDVYIVVKYGVSLKAVAEAFKESIEYKVEKFSGMLVDYVNVNIINVKK